MGPLNARQRAVQNVTWVRHSQALPRPHKRAHEDCQQIIAAVAADDPFWINAKNLRRSHSKRCSKRIGILGQRAVGRRSNDRPSHCRRRWVGIFIGVELDPLAPLRLLTRRVGRERGNA